ncbi:MAG: HAMP domain-containing protein [Methylococcales bacterium]|jgi:adenylate cyclase|nr:HAMP domain-containing protein [Methylococcales bacterium]
MKIFSFRYKLALVISSLLLVSIFGVFYVVQTNLEKQFVQTIKSDLGVTRNLVFRLMRNRQKVLGSYALSLEGDRMIRDVLTDKTMDRETANDIVKEEILGNYTEIDILTVLSPDGKVIASSMNNMQWENTLQAIEVYSKALTGEVSSGYLFVDNICFQLIATPVFIREEMIGINILAIKLGQKEINDIQQMSSVELAFFRKDQVFLSTKWHEKYSSSLLFEKLDEIPIDSKQKNLQQTTLGGERYLYYSVSEQNFFPDFILAKSLDKELVFVEKIRNDAILIGLIVLMFGFILSIFFASSISKPIQALRKATEEVDQQNYDYRLHIQSKDEFALLSDSFNSMMSGLAEREKMRGVMHKVVSKEIAEELLSKGGVSLGGEEREVSILFSDIRGFTQISEGMSASELLDLLNEYFTRVSLCIDDNFGVIDKYIGDAIMAIFGAPVTHNHDAVNSVLAAQAMVEALMLFNNETADLYGKELEVGIGINTGTVVAGNMGSENRLNYTVLGDEVNLASRLEGLTKKYGVHIIISGSTYDALLKENVENKHLIICRALEKVQVKGKVNAVMIYQVFSPTELLLDNFEQCLSAFHRAIDFFHQKMFDEAYELLKQLHKEHPKDGPVKLFKEKCELYLEEPSYYDRHYVNGAFRFNEK